MLHVTNREASVPALRAAGIGGDVLPWRDPLHEGPVPDLPVEELRDVRAAFLARTGRAPEDEARATLLARDRRLLGACGHACEELVLWFQNDLHDQLQIVQVLARRPPRARLALAGVEEWVALAQLSPEEVRHLFEEAEPVTRRQLDAAEAVWAAFTSPAMVERVRAVDASALPGLPEALERLLGEVPGGDGLTPSERRLLEAVAAGASTPGQAFRAAEAREERPFLDEAAARARLQRMAPLVGGDPLALTPRGAAVLRGDERWHDRPPLALGGATLG